MNEVVEHFEFLEKHFAKEVTETPLLFPESHTIEQTVKLIEHGVDPYLYRIFKSLTPTIVFDRRTGKLVHHWDRNYGHPANWIIKNANFCLNFCIETALKFQKEEDNRYKLIRYQEVYEDTIESMKDEMIIWDKPVRPLMTTSSTTKWSAAPRKSIYTLRKGQTIIGFARDTEPVTDEWFIISDNLPAPIKEMKEGYGCVPKKDGKITSRKKQTKRP